MGTLDNKPLIMLRRNQRRIFYFVIISILTSRSSLRDSTPFLN